MDKILSIAKALEGKGKGIFSIFFSDWYSLKEASKIYNPQLPKGSRSNRTVAYYFYQFKKLGLLEEKNVTKEFPRKTANGKDSVYPSKCPRYRTNCEFFFFEKKISLKMKDFLLLFLNQDIVREYLIQNYKEDIPLGIEEIIKQLLLISVSFESLEALGKGNRLDRECNTTIFDLLNINFKNYKSILNKKIEEIENKIIVKEKFRVILNLFASVMENLFLTTQMEEIEKISSFYKNYLWLFNMWNDLKWTNLSFRTNPLKV